MQGFLAVRGGKISLSVAADFKVPIQENMFLIQAALPMPLANIKCYFCFGDFESDILVGVSRWPKGCANKTELLRFKASDAVCITRGSVEAHGW